MSRFVIGGTEIDITLSEDGHTLLGDERVKESFIIGRKDLIEIGTAIQIKWKQILEESTF